MYPDQIGQHVMLQHIQHAPRDLGLLPTVHVAHVAHPARTVVTRGAEEGVDVVSVDGHFGEGAAEVVGDGGVAPVGESEADEADTCQQGGGAIEDEFGLVLRYYSPGLLSGPFSSFSVLLKPSNWSIEKSERFDWVGLLRIFSGSSKKSAPSGRSGWHGVEMLFYGPSWFEWGYGRFWMGVR